MWPNPLFATDLVTISEEILNRKLHFCALIIINLGWKKLKMSDYYCKYYELDFD